jgi:outer membrane protein assembly factor BamB
VAILILQWLIITVPGFIAPATQIQFFGWMIGPLVGAVGLMAWWVFASRIRWADRWLGLVVFIAAGAATAFLSHSSFGIFGVMLYALPTVVTAWVIWLLVTPFLRWPVRRVGLLIVLILAWGCHTLVRNEGVDGSFSAAFRPRWTQTSEQQFLAELEAGKLGRAQAATASSAVPTNAGPDDWPGFRGPNRDGRLTGVRIATDWNAHPPKQLWRHRVGPGWSSFAVVGDRAFTQEQRGENEDVVCYDATTGAELWNHADTARFTETMAGPGPRATPTFHDGKIYVQGATGRLNCIDVATNRVLWSRDIAADSGAQVPTWGFAASPLIFQGVVSVFAGGPDGASVLGYNASSGELAWSAGEGQFSYCSPHPVRMGDVEQIVISTEKGLTAFDPVKGTILWRHSWPLEGGMARVVQPTFFDNSEFLIGTGFGIGTQRVHVAREGDNWTTQEVWTTKTIKPYYNDVVVHQGHAYGFDNNFFTCVSLADGKSKWRARGYGSGQVLLLADQSLLLILSEKGEVALVEAIPEKHSELARFQAIEGKTWNHPVIAHGKLFVRNGEEAACYELSVEPAKAVSSR